MAQYSSKYSFELWNRQGLLLLDLAGRAKSRQVVMSRNEAEEISFSLDLNELERFCNLSGVDPATILLPGSTEVRVKRLGTYLCGGQINYLNPRLGANGQTVDIRATGFLNLFSQRFTPDATTYSATQATDIAWNVINGSQTQTNGSYGITRGRVATVGVQDRVYNRSRIKDILQDLTVSTLTPFDFEFTYDKVFNTYTKMGSDKPEIIFEYPNNITDLSAPIDATSLANQIIAIGTGYGTAQATFTTNDTISQAAYALRQKIVNVNAADNSNSQLTDAANAEKYKSANPLTIPSISVDGNKAPYVTDYKIGDRVQVKVNNYKLLRYINGMYRIEKITLNLTDDDSENITLAVSQ